MTAPDLETRVYETGSWLYRLLEAEAPSVFQKKYWTDKVTEWCMHDEAFKVEMFRFVDVLPYLHHTESIARHIREYFSRPGMHMPSGLQWGIKFLSPNWVPAKMIAKTVARNIESMGKQFIAGADPREALPVLEDLRSKGMAFAVDLLGEAVVSEEEAEEYLRRYFHLFDILDRAQGRWAALGNEVGDKDWGFTPKINVAIKTSAMYSQMNACAFDRSIAMAKERLRPIIQKAMQIGAFVCLDMEQYSLKNLTLALYRSLMEEPGLRSYPHTGIVIQAYLHDSEKDLLEMIDWARKRKTRLTIRLVKGAYWDSEIIWARQKNWPVPVFTNKHETDINFEKLARIILENHQYVTLACASHNLRSIAYVMESAKDFRVPADRLEYQVLYGMGEPVRNAIHKADLPVRLYTPIGEMIQGMAYLVRRLLENTANESFLRQSFAQKIPKEVLLRSPLEQLRQHPSDFELIREEPEYGVKGPFRNEPHLDWTRAEHRQHFAKTLAQTRSKLPFKVPLSVAGTKINTGQIILSRNPNKPEEVVGIVTAAGRTEADRAIHAAGAAFPEWKRTDPVERAEYLFKAAAAARKMRYDLAALQVFEVGKTWSEADADVCEAIDFLEYYGREMIRLGKPRRMGHVQGELSHLFYEPRGVAVVIAPWNFPMAISMGMTSAAIVTGNTVVYKPASQSPVIGSMIHRVFEEAKLPAGVLSFLPGPGSEIGDYLVTHPDVALIAFTGSRDVGLRIVELAGKTPREARSIKNVIAEMGGKNAIIVDVDADMDEAILHVLQSAFGYQGQKCSACSRLIIMEENYEKFVERLKAAAESLELGPPENPENFMGAVIEEAALKKVLEYIEIGKKEGKLLLERRPGHLEGYFAPLTIFEGIRPEHRLAQEEIFGPVLSVMKVRSFDEALRVANDTQYALTGAIFSRSPENIARATKELRTGNLYINRGCTGAIVGRHPFGGFKMSGVGSKAGGPDYLLQFMVPRNVVENTLRRGFAPVEE